MVVTPLFGIPMGPELVVILLIAILLFGANKIPKLARSTGQAIGEFEKGKTKAEQELEDIRNGETDLTEIDAEGESTTETESSGTSTEESGSSE
ncbi:twin-arginine translocation protein, TatA/E family subunit [Salinarchaeum sp. Harcht-Bsk1]|uniref:Sec-independent protein translocase subunit TatA/TatB n=1 Tax=Salinarchaeum sp. Harcht-Bsk1 TaxID=1333523 RepID=UPI0003423911|nr:twin-arginine translocase TatA/TatE family subunit [Salinarchaeum sp. Harcht-Bsk1]AGN02654.1 twin-arginine translocation protein, TatA/E family subunit [Salinarchaeum sp. Harcht-Bsk1]